MAMTGKGAALMRFGRYNALTKLGQGAMATVYLAEDPSLNRMVAIKVIHSHLASNSSLLDRFTVEAKTAAVLRNPNIVEIFDYGMEDDTQYLVMEYIDGPNLQFVLNLLGGEPMAPEEAAAVICQASDGLGVAEKTGVVHRDIKPENMMFTSEGVLKIADFGIAHISEQNLTQTGSILGSPNFMSPEQIDGRKPTHHTDLFSLGAVFYYCLTGQKPFSGPNIPTIMRSICDLPHQPVPELITDADPFLAGLVDTLLQKNPEDRGGGARWLSLQLRGYLNQKGILDLGEVTKGLLDRAAQRGGSQTMVDLTPPPGADEPAQAKRPIQPGMRAEKAKSGTGVKPGTWQATRGTGHGGRMDSGRSHAGSGVDFNHDGKGAKGTRHGAPGSHKALWIGGGIAGVLMLAAAGFIVATGGGQDTAAGGPKPAEQAKPAAPKVESIVLQPASMEIQAGQTRRFLAQVLPAGAAKGVRWESSDPAVAAVVEGEVSAVNPGVATIRAFSVADGSKVGSAEVTVAAASRPEPAPDPRPRPRPEPRPDPRPDPRPVPKAPEPAEKPQASKAVVTITSAPPFAEVIVGGLFLGTTPVKNKELPVGRHKVQVIHRSFPPLDTVVNLGPGPKTFRFRLFR
jgi:serine/threonine-protein kinase